MSSDRLRAAAKTLRQRAEDATPGPWESAPVELGHYVSGTVYEVPDENCEYPQFERYEDARYIATMHPGVALALVDWLDACGDFMADHPGYRHDGEDYAARVADLILGDQP